MGENLKANEICQTINPESKNPESELVTDFKEVNNTMKNINEIPDELLQKACSKVEQHFEKLSFLIRGITITHELIKVTMEILNAEPAKQLPQNCRNDKKERTPDGLDKRIKERLNSDLRTANIISDVLEKAGIVKVIQVKNPETKRMVKGTKLLPEWYW